MGMSCGVVAIALSVMSAVPEADLSLVRYDASTATEIETRWQRYWDEVGIYNTPNTGSSAAETAFGPKLFVMDMFPYPSGSGLHVGHPLGFIATDVYTRFKRMCGFNVLYTMGFDAFGLPAEEHARQTGQHPRVNTEANIANMRRQLSRLGLGHDKRRSIATTDTNYYRWTQWIFLQIFNSWFDPATGRARPISELVAEFESGDRLTPEGLRWQEVNEAERRRILDSHRLAYLAETPVNWCPALGTVLSNEEVTAQGRSERGNHEVVERPLRQWMMRICAYADRLLADLDHLDWPESVKTMQRNWIGRSEGAWINFTIAPHAAHDEADAASAEITDASPEATVRTAKLADAAVVADVAATAEHDADLVAEVDDAVTVDDAATADAATERIRVFTTRPDTLFGTTYLVLAPEHPLVDEITASAWPVGTCDSWTAGAATPTEAVADYRAISAQKTDIDRSTSKTGVYLGSNVVVPFTSRQVPVFIADYVIMGYGTGAVMGVPGEDQRDRDFAETFGLEVIRTVQPPQDHPDDQAYAGDGPSINSLFLDGLGVEASKALILQRLDTGGFGGVEVNYKLRDWLFSRQRYWGEPIPVVFDDLGPVALPEQWLPLELPELDDWSPRALAPDSEPEPPLGRVTEWVTAELDLGEGPRLYRRELSTMPQWAGSCWYYLRYLDPDNDQAFVDPEVERYWMADPSPGGVGGVDLYVGGVEHAVLHLLYARFWHKVLCDLGHVSGVEPFKRLINQGYILAYSYKDDRGVYVPADEVEGSVEAGFTHRGQPVLRELGKMGKSLKNSVTPDDMYAAYGADTLRLYEMFMGPIHLGRPWEPRSVVGSQRMLQRVWRNMVDEHTGELRVTDKPAEDGLRRLLHRTIDGVRADMEDMRFNTAIAKLTELNNELTRGGAGTPREVADPLLRMLAPLVPHFAEELWHRLHGAGVGSVVLADFPTADPDLLVDLTVEVPVQVNGKLRGRVTIAADADEATALAAALAESNVAAHVGGRELRKQLYVPGRMITLVV